MALNYPILQCELGGIAIDPPGEWTDLKIEAVFGEVAEGATDEVQARISLPDLTFANEGAGIIDEAIARGITATGGGLYVGLPFSMTLTDGSSTLDLVKGYLDLANGLTKVTTNTYRARAVELRSLDDVERKLSAITYGYLEQQGHITGADYREVEYIVDKDDTSLDQLMLRLVAFMMARELAASIYRIKAAAANVAAILTGGGVATSVIGSLLLAGLLLALEIAYAAALVIAMKNLFEEILNEIIPIKHKHKSITLQKALEKAFSFIGYTFTSAVDISNLVFVPSKSQGTDFISTRSKTGIPNTNDFGYNCLEMVNLAKMLTYGRLYVDGTKVTLYSKADPFWRQLSDYVMPDMLFELEPVNYNSADLKGTQIISFVTDPTDWWTVENFTGTNYEIVMQNLGQPDQRYNLLKGYTELRIPVALGNRKDKLNAVEKLAAEIGFVVDSMVKLFGGSSSFGTSVRNRRGFLKVGTKYHAIPKILYMNGRLIPSNHRDYLSARALWLNYYSYDSFGEPNFRGQKRVYLGVKLPMGYVDFLKAKKSKYFKTQSGKSAEWLSLKWAFDKDYAECDIAVQQTYTKNLKTILIEA